MAVLVRHICSEQKNTLGHRCCKATVPNLVYAKNLKGQFKKTPRFSMKQLTNAHKGVGEFYFFCLGVRKLEKGWELLL